MQDIVALQDALIADEINRISSLPREALISELIDIKSRTIENASPQEILKFCNRKHHDD